MVQICLERLQKIEQINKINLNQNMNLFPRSKMFSFLFPINNIY